MRVRYVSMFLVINHCAILLLMIPPLEPLHTRSEVLDIIKSYLDEVPFPHNGDDMVNN